MATVSIDNVAQIGEMAGLVWHTLEEHGPQSLAKLVKLIDAPRGSRSLALVIRAWSFVISSTFDFRPSTFPAGAARRLATPYLLFALVDRQVSILNFQREQVERGDIEPPGSRAPAIGHGVDRIPATGIRSLLNL